MTDGGRGPSGPVDGRGGEGERVAYRFDETRHRTQSICQGCLAVGFSERRHHFAVMDFREAGWKMVPTRGERQGYWLCPECAGALR